MGKLIRINPYNPQGRFIKQVINCLKNDGVIIYPTDTVYAFGCDIQSKKALTKVARLKGLDPKKAQFSCICSNMKEVGEYANQISTPVYKMMKRAFPGPYTFILQASKRIPRHFQSRKKTVGIRISNHQIPLEIVKLLGNPILTASLKTDDEILEYEADPEIIFEEYGNKVDFVIDGGFGGILPSTVIDCTDSSGQIEILREGQGELAPLGLSI